jgi:hypothetical protein
MGRFARKSHRWTISVQARKRGHRLHNDRMHDRNPL